MHPKELSLIESLVQAWFIFTAMGVYSSLSVWFIDRDMRKLTPERLLRAYSTTSFAAAILCGLLLGFPQIAVVVHFIRTRRSLWGLVQGLLWSALTFVPMLLLAEILEQFFPD